jgi:hypothetical protein
MNNEISEEAKKSLVNAARQRAFRRLERDGAHSTAALQRRVRALAEERNIPTADIHKLMYKKPTTQSVMVFCEKYRVSYDWILCGDLRGLQKMSQSARTDQAERKEVASRMVEKYNRLPSELQKIVETTVDRLLEQRQ